MASEKGKHIVDSLNWRCAAKIFDSGKKVSQEDLHTILESGRLAPSSSGIEPWKFIVVTNPEVRQKLRVASYDQPKVTDASHIVIIARRTDSENISPDVIARTAKAQGKSEEDLDGLKKMVDQTVSMKSDGDVRDGWIAAQTYIPLGIMVQTAALLKIDTCPMEGFDPSKVNVILGLSEKNLSATTMLAIGYRGDDPYADLPKTRQSYDEVVEFV
ncbi:MAG: NAD(P)H-dependent oxidoreductase [bacterium]|nr:NAD(P)H-dependent oxidoreductase [bacterium]